MGWMEQVRSSLIAGALMAVWVAQPPLVLGEVPSDNRINAGRDGHTRRHGLPFCPAIWRCAHPASRAECPSTHNDAVRSALTA